MKNLLLGTTALGAVAILAAGNVSASEKIKLGVGGYMQSTYYYADYDDNEVLGVERIDDKVTQEGEVFFTGSTTLDNGIKFGVNIQLEAYTATDQIDETYVFIEGSFGRVLLGSENSAAYLMHYGAPSPVSMYAADSANIAPIGVGNTTNATMFSDADKITYFTPRFEGIQLGASYVPDGSFETSGSSVYSPTEIKGGLDRGYSLGANYVKSFDSLSVSVSAGYENADVSLLGADLEEMKELSFGGQIGFGGFTVGGGYLKSTDIGGLDTFDAETWSMGVKYGQGPWSVGVDYSNGDGEYAGVDLGSLETWTIGGQYVLGPGIKAFGGIQLYDNDLGDEIGLPLGLQGDSTIFFVGTALNF